MFLRILDTSLTIQVLSKVIRALGGDALVDRWGSTAGTADQLLVRLIG